MCGIFGYIGSKNNAPQIVLDGLKRLEYRGYDSWGIAYKSQDKGQKNNNGQLKVIKNVGKIGEANIVDTKSNIAFGHTRWATHGGVTIENAHPHLDCSGKVGVVHNGIIENFQKLIERLKNDGHIFSSETDTEGAAHTIEDYIKAKNSPLEATRRTFLDLTGRNAVIAFFPEVEEFVVAKNGSPIVIGCGKREYYFASDASALLPLTKDVIFLEDGIVASVSSRDVKIFDIRTGTRHKSNWQKLDWKTDEAEKGEFDYYLIKEIMDQRYTIAQTVTQSETSVRDFADLIRTSYGTHFVGAGTASYACLSGVYIFSKIAKRHVNFILASEFPYAEHFIRPDSLLVGVSQSGETADVLEAVNAARNNGAKIGAIVNVIGSTLSRVSNMNLPQRAGPEKAVLGTKSFTSMLACMYLLAFTLVGEYRRGREVMLAVTEKVEDYLSDRNNLDRLQKVAKRIMDKDHLFTLGRGLSYPIALEAALKIKEASYIHAEGFAGGELKHGVIALVEKGTPFLVFVPNDETRAEMISNVMEVKARGAHIIAVSPQNNEIFDDWIGIPDVGIGNPIMSVIPAQLLAYYLTVARGLDPDKPRNLAKSVTVK